MSLLTISFLALSAILLCEIFEIRSKLWYFIVGLLIVCSPFTSNIITYYYCSDAYAISFLMAIFSVYLTRKVQYAWKYPVCIALIAYSISIFQSSLGIICALYLLVLLDMAFQGQSAAYTLKYMRDMVLLCILGLLVYLVVLKLWLSVTGLTMLSYKGANQISLISTLKNLPKTIPAAYNDFYAFFFSSSSIVKNPISVKICYGVVFSLFLLSTLKILFSQKAPWLWIILLICLLPMACNILNLAAPETTIILRTACGMVVAFPAIFLITIKNLGEKKCKLSFSAVSRGLCLCACAVLAWTQIIICNMDSMYMKTNRDVILSCSQNMFAQLQNREDVQNGAPVAIIGTPTSWMSDSTLKENVNTYAKDALVWSSADGMWNGWFRINQRYIGAKWIRWCDFDTYTSLIATGVTDYMPAYPFTGYIQNVNGIVICNVGGEKNLQ